MVSSLGYHTMELSLKLTVDESLQLMQTFEKNKDVYIKNNHNGSVYQRSVYYYIGYRQPYKGLSWTLRYCKHPPEYMQIVSHKVEDRCCSIKARINPKILLGLDDYIASADRTYLKDLIAVFNQEAKKLSPILKDFFCYSINRIDYCVNFDLEDLRIGLYPADYMVLIQQADIPNHFIEHKEYQGTTHRKKPGLNSFYLKNNSVHINCYWKYYQLQTQFPSVPYIDDSFYIIRFEVQCLYLKTNLMQKQIKDYDNFENLISVMLSDEFCQKVITSYYYKTIGRGDYYSLDAARKKIKSMNFNQNKEDRLLKALKLVNLHRGIFKAKSHLQGKELADLKRSMIDLGEIGINPVTIPRERGIKFLPNLLNTYLANREAAEKAFAEYYKQDKISQTQIG